MNVWNDTALLGIYTLTPTHFGTGQTTGQVDLPIARDAFTGFPVLPATGIKGVIRDYASMAKLQNDTGRAALDVDKLFGKLVDPNNKADTLEAGRLAFTEARLVAYPVRSLNRSFLYVTCPSILDGLARDLRSVGGETLLEVAELPMAERDGAWVADASLEKDPALVLEYMVFASAEFRHSAAVATLAERLSALIPAEEPATRERFKRALVVIPDGDFEALMQTVIPVQARIKLGPNKTTDDGGNLWYEERLPSDCLFVAFVGERRSRDNGGRQGNAKADLGSLVGARAAFAVMQIGGNETVGNGLCRCTVLHTPVSSAGATRGEAQ